VASKRVGDWSCSTAPLYPGIPSKGDPRVCSALSGRALPGPVKQPVLSRPTSLSTPWIFSSAHGPPPRPRYRLADRVRLTACPPMDEQCPANRPPAPAAASGPRRGNRAGSPGRGVVVGEVDEAAARRSSEITRRVCTAVNRESGTVQGRRRRRDALVQRAIEEVRAPLPTLCH